MIWRAEVHVRRFPNRELDPIGIIVLDGAAKQNEHVLFALDGETVGGCIELIDPPDWRDRPAGTVPKVVISLDRMLGPAP